MRTSIASVVAASAKPEVSDGAINAPRSPAAAARVSISAAIGVPPEGVSVSLPSP